MEINNDIKKIFDEVIKAFYVIVNAEDVSKANNAIVDAANIIAINVAVLNKDYSTDTEDLCKLIYDYTFLIVTDTSNIELKHAISMAANAITNAITAFANPGTFDPYKAAYVEAVSSITEFKNEKVPPLGI